MLVKKLWVFLVILCLMSCGKSYQVHQQHKTKGSINKENRKVSVYDVQIKKCLNDTTVPAYFKEVFLRDTLVKADDDLMLSIIDSLYTTNDHYAFFYFTVFTKSMKGADGFYSEGVGLDAMRYIKIYADRFALYFNKSNQFTKHDLNNWGLSLYCELSIVHGENQEQGIKELEHYLKTSIQAWNKEDKKVIEELIASVYFYYSKYH